MTPNLNPHVLKLTLGRTLCPYSNWLFSRYSQSRASRQAHKHAFPAYLFFQIQAVLSRALVARLCLRGKRCKYYVNCTGLQSSVPPAGAQEGSCSIVEASRLGGDRRWRESANSVWNCSAQMCSVLGTELRNRAGMRDWKRLYLLICVFSTAALKRGLLYTLLYSNSLSFTRPQGDLFPFEQAENVAELTE